MKVLVTDAANRVALAVVRALGKAGAQVAVVEQERFAGRSPAAFLSKHVTRTEVVPSIGDGDRFVAALARAAGDADVLVPVSTNVLLECAKHRDRFSARLPVPSIETIRRANDKSSVLAVARKAGVPIPVSYAPESDEELEEVIGRLKLPAVVKLRDDEGTYLEPARRYAVGKTAEEVRRHYRTLHAIRPFPVIQEKVEGDGYGVGFLAREGRVLASFCHHRVREYPVSGGPSALCESVRDPQLTGYAIRLAEALGWTGVAMAEFKKDGGDYRLLEVNPRFWGSLPLATRAGVNFPDLLCRMAMGEEPKAVGEVVEGVKLRFLTLDVSATWSALFNPERRDLYLSGFLRDLFDPGVQDGLIDPDDLRATMAYILGRLP